MTLKMIIKNYYGKEYFMKIAFVCTEMLPVPPVLGGAYSNIYRRCVAYLIKIS